MKVMSLEQFKQYVDQAVLSGDKNARVEYHLLSFQYSDGDEAWEIRENGLLHCEWGPAVVKPDGAEEWYYMGLKHRTNGPAATWSDGSQLWYCMGQLHRIDGPAVVRPNGTKWWYCNYQVTSSIAEQIEEFNYKVNIALLALDKSVIIKVDNFWFGWDERRQYWCACFVDKIHREDGPSIIEPDGTQKWYCMGQLHRVDGPAVIYASGVQEYLCMGKLHRTNGPAVIRPNGVQEWYCMGKPLNIKKEVTDEDSKF